MMQTFKKILSEVILKHTKVAQEFGSEDYFDIYHHHLREFRNQKVNILEIGVYSGGSLGMWQQYFGDRATV